MFSKIRLLSVVFVFTTGQACAGLSAQEILAASDAIRNPDKPFALNVRLVEYLDKEERDSTSLSVYAKADGKGSGQYNNLVRILQPARDANKLLLKNGNDIWLFDPRTKASIQLSPQQRLLGQAANGDVVTVNLARDYRAELAGEETVVDGDRQQRDCYRLKLKADAPDVTYHAIDYWIEKQTSRPVKARFYSATGHLLKTAYYRRFEQQLGKLRPTETVIIDGVAAGWVTVMRYANYAYRDIPDSWLQREYLPQFKPE